MKKPRFTNKSPEEGMEEGAIGENCAYDQAKDDASVFQAGEDIVFENKEETHEDEEAPEKEYQVLVSERGFLHGSYVLVDNSATFSCIL